MLFLYNMIFFIILHKKILNQIKTEPLRAVVTALKRYIKLLNKHLMQN